ncbi:unnamed protein product [Lupinus luteus]|uniref:FLZ-type domain-containing protein n=1 Tax=Lupinus luteus TaxID=3873 RepID=A0AAV1YGC1_LUPLU
MPKNQEHIGKMEIADVSYNYFHCHALGSNVKSNSIFKAPFLSVGLDPEGLLDSDSVRSPTSPLDFTFSNLGNPSRRLDCSKVGLSIIDSLEDDNKKPCLCPQMVIKAPNCKICMESVKASESLPEDFCKLSYTKNGSTFHKGESSTVVLEIAETLLENPPTGKTSSCSLYSDGLVVFNQVSSHPPDFIGGCPNSNTFLTTESNASVVSLCSSNDFVKSLSASVIEQSEDYTCVISHGPNPKTTRIFCDCILETHSDDFENKCKNEENKEGVSSVVVNRSQSPNQYPSIDFLSLCYHCNKKLEEGKDIYIYRGEKAFCSLACRAFEIMINEEMEESGPDSENSSKWESGEELFETGIPTATKQPFCH